MGDSPVTGRSSSPRRAGVPLPGRELPLNLDLSRREMLKLTGYTSMAAFLAAFGHGTFQDQISSYLQGTPDDVFTWFSGHRMRFFADQGLATSLNDTWDKV